MKKAEKKKWYEGQRYHPQTSPKGEQLSETETAEVNRDMDSQVYKRAWKQRNSKPKAKK